MYFKDKNDYEAPSLTVSWLSTQTVLCASNWNDGSIDAGDINDMGTL